MKFSLIEYIFVLFVVFLQQILGNFTSVHLSYVELKNMGQQRETGRYPLHFHMCGDVDRRGGYWEPTYADGLSIHHSFSRCLAVHATNGLLVSCVFLKALHLHYFIVLYYVLCIIIGNTL